MTKPVLKNKVVSLHTRKQAYVIAGTSAQIESKNAATLDILGHTWGFPAETLVFLGKYILLCLPMGKQESPRSFCKLSTD